MKKLLVAILGIFMVLGSCILSACGTEQASLTLSAESVSVEVRSDQVGSDQAIITADVSGVSNYKLEASANGYDEFLTVSTEKVSESKTNIIIKGVSENDTPSVVTVRVSPGNVEKYIYVDVYSQIKSISQNFDADAKKNNYLVKGATTSLDADSLLSVEPVKARKDITWAFDGEYAGATLDGENLTISETFEGSEIKLKVTASNGVTPPDSIVLPVLDKINESVSLKWSYDQTSSFEAINDENNNFVIVSNVDDDDNYDGFVVIDYVGELSITGYAVDANGNQTDSIVVNRYGEYNGLPLFRVSAMQGKSNLNGNFKVGFKIGYANYNYSFDTITASPIYISAREKVNDITITDKKQSADIEGTLQTLYTDYVDSATATGYGPEYHVSITPTTVIDASNQYAIIVTFTQAPLAPISDGCPVEFWYRDIVNGNRWTQILMTEQNGNYVISGGNYPTTTTIYMKASSGLAQQSVEGISVIFQSIDNPVISTSFNVKLVKSVSIEDFVFEDGDFRIDSSENNGDIVKKKQFTIEGQTSTEGLSVVSESKNVTFSDIQYISNDEKSVTFEVALTLKKSSYGVTSLDTYQIVHQNGLISEEMNIDIFLPLKDASVRHNSGENLSNSVTDEAYDANTYLLNGDSTHSTAIGLSRLMLKNDTTTPVFYSFNEINDYYADAQISVGFVDFEETADFDLDAFKALTGSKETINQLIADALENGNTKSNIAYFTNDYNSIITKGVGHTYAVVFFKGKAVENIDDEGNTTLVRIILIESYISPNGINVNPDSDKNTTLYSVDSLSSSDAELTKKTINIRFSNSNVTYTTFDNLEIISRNSAMGKQSNKGDNTITWEYGRYSLSNVAISDRGISFNIEVVGTFGELAFYDTLDIHYVLKNDDGEKVYDIYTPISITIKNAQRIENLTWKNADEDGLYFEVGDVKPQYIMLEASPTNAKNNNIHYVRTESDGKFIDRNDDFVSITDEISANTLAVNLSNEITQGMTGYIYLLPSDAVYNNQIKYYYIDVNETDESAKEKQGIITDSMLGEYKDSARGITYYDFLISEAYFKSNASDSDEVKNVSFAQILIKIKVVVADGSSFEHSYRIFDNAGFTTMKSDLYYTVMTSLDLTGETYIQMGSFDGGLQGANDEITIKLDGKGFANSISKTAEVRNITFIGNVTGDGFVASTNYGTITNVTIDVDGIYPSILTVSGVYGGGLVGTNYGTITSSNVLGLNITGTNASIGGVAGRNFGDIDLCRVEFYNLAVAGKTKTYAVNKFNGSIAGAIVGIIENGSSITKTFAYNYALSSATDQVLVASMMGAFAGAVGEGVSATDTIIDYSFAVINLTTPYADYNAQTPAVNLSNYYFGYLTSDNKLSISYSTGYKDNSNFVSTGKEGFFSYVNGENEYHLKDIMQDEKVDSVDYSVATTKDANGYYKSVAVETEEDETEQGIIFFYAIESGAKDLTNSETNDLKKLNTISLAQLVEEEYISKNIIITSSNPTIVKVVGSSLQILKTGKVTLTLSSKQNVQINKTIEVAIIYSMSEMQISWVNVAGKINYVQEDSILTLQKTRSRDFMVGYDKTSVYLGATTNPYELIANQTSLEILTSVEEDQKAVSVEKTSANSFKVTANDDASLTNFEVSPVVFTDSILQNAISSLFKREFSLRPVDGAISFGVSGEEFSITPSTNTTVKVEVKTTDANDGLVPVINYNKQQLKFYVEDGRYAFMLPRDVESKKAIIMAVVERISKSLNGEVYTFTYNVTFSVGEGYETDIAEDMDFEVHFESLSGNSSKDWNGKFTLTLTRQKFTNIDVQIIKVRDSQYTRDDRGNIVEVHNAEEKVAVLAPGNTAIMQVNINPTFAYFDYVDFSYSFGEDIVLDAVNIEVVEPFGKDGNQFTRRAVDGRIETFSTSLRYTPTATEKARGAIYFKVWINTTVEKDSRITFTATFKEAGNEKPLSTVKSYLTISYLTQPKVTIDGSDTAYMAVGSTVQVRIDVLADQKVDMVSIDGDNVKGVYISSLSDAYPDEVKGINTYYATLSASILASAGESNSDPTDDGMFALQAQVSRELNGKKEYKTAVANIVLVDFKLDSDNITITGTSDDNLVVWQGVPKTFNVEYNLLPETYNEGSDEASQNKLKEINEAREFFLQYEYYPKTENAEDSKYLINYVYDKNGNLVTDEYGLPKYETLEDRLFYVIGNETRSIKDTSVESPVQFNYEDGQMSVTGLKSSGEVELVLYTYISAGGVTATYKKYFTITLDVYSDEDLPVMISDATEFNALNPEGQTNIKQNDYILTSDIVLENYTAFDTKAIRSLDGNGYTIYIKSFDTTPDSNILNLALFKNVVTHTIDGEEVPTTLKNIRVNLYNGGQIIVNTNKYKTINIAGLAIENSGIITNCEVVSFYNEGNAVGEAGLEYKACTAHSNKTGINVKYVDGVNTTQQVYHDGNADWTSQVAGFVITNNGSITNSRVGGDTVIMAGSEKLIDGKASGYTYASEQQLDTFNIVGQGNMAGFVLTNSGGYIASSFAKNIDMENKSNSTSFYVAGFVGINTSSIITSYVEGVESDKEVLDADPNAHFAKEGSSIKSEMGYIAGFIYNNSGTINDSYSNILIANSTQAHKVYLASGFVYMNEGRLENCYSASQILNSNFTQMNFSGVSATGELLTTGVYINCYFFNKAYAAQEDQNDNTTESRYSTGAVLITSPNVSSYFYGFAIADGESDGVWRKDDENGITLIEANNISISHRYVHRVDDDYEGVTAEDDEGKYVLPYATLTFLGKSTEIDTSLGGKNNPILVVDAQDWVEVTGLSESSSIKKYYNTNSIWGTYRLVNHIDLSLIASSDKTVVLPSSDKSFSGSLYGNGFEISGISMSSDNTTNIAFGLFASIEARDGISPIITNVNLKVDQVIAGDTAMVGALAGYIKDSYIINVEIALNDNSMVSGLNFVGTLAGLAFGNNVIKNIVVENPSITANRYKTETTGDYFTAENLKGFRTNLKNNLNFNTTAQSEFFNSINNYSYAGGVIGFVDNYAVETREFDFDQRLNDYSVNNIRINGVTKIQGQVVGGAFGLLGYQTNIRDVGLYVEGTTGANSSYILATKYFAGGIAGQSFGSINRTFASHEESIQDTIEDGMASYYANYTSSSVERGILNLFYSSNANYTQKYIGGLVGYVGSGNIEISYSKLNVTSPTAEYAGGIIGGTELAGANAYQTDAKLAFQNSFTKLFLNEVYATGDVRAKTYAGGIIGAIKGEGSRVALLAVNAFNYFTTYDYQSGEYLALNEGQTNVSNNFKVNSLVGSFINDDGNAVTITVNEGSITDGYKSYLQLMKSVVEEGSTGEKSELASVAVFEDYKFSGTSEKMSLFTTSITTDYQSLRENNLIYIITGPDKYENSSEGYTYTQEGFLNSGTWTYINWNHSMSDLYPEIRYKETAEVIYLDNYDIADTFAKMQNSNRKVVIRGLESKDSEKHVDINLDDYFRDYYGWTEGDSYPVLIEQFKGILQGGIYSNEETGEKVKIIASQNFIDSTGVGFIADGVIVEYDSNKEYIELDSNSGNAGLFSNSAIADATLSNIELILKKPVIVSQTGSALNVGLIAPTITNTSLNNIKIVTDFTDATLSIEGESTATALMAETESILNAGLIAGRLTQSSSISIMQVNDIELDLKSDLIAVSETNFDKYNVGGFFGQTALGEGSQELRINISQISKKQYGSSEQVASKIMITDPQNSPTLSVGGYIGNAIGISNIGVQDGEAIDTKLDFVFNGSSSIGELNVGGLFGYSNSQLSIAGLSSTITNNLQIASFVKKLMAGGLVGQTDANTLSIDNFLAINHNIIAQSGIGSLYSGGVVGLASSPLAISNISNINFTASKSEEPTNPDQNSLGGADYDNSERITITTAAHVGIVAGRAIGSQFKYTGNSGSDSTNLNAGKQTIKLMGKGINFGSILGSTNSETNSETNSVEITGKIISNAQVVVAGATDSANLGGMIGNIEGQSSTGTTSRVQIGDALSKIRFDGAFYTNAKTVNAGGIVGLYSSSKPSSTLSIANTSFGGAVKVYGENSNESALTFGGTLGNTSITSAESSVTIESNYNYGDVYVEYDDALTSVTDYTFGGIIGNATGSGYKVEGNYSLTTSHNSRQSSENKKVNALFGNGIATESADNYYNHAVTLTTDYYGVDAGYTSGYSDVIECFGYNGKSNSTSSITLTSSIKDWLDTTFEVGHKLNPSTIELNSNVYTLPTATAFNGMTYYTISGNISNDSIHYIDSEDNRQYSLNNVAIIGSGNTINYNVKSTETESYKDNTGLIRELTGYSYLSGFVVNSDITIENADADLYYGTVVGTLSENASVYAMQVQGKVEVGGTNSANVSGLVGKFNSGRLYDCSTDLDITYRAGANGNTYGLAFTEVDDDENSLRIIENSYVAGSIKTMIDSNVYAFANGIDATITNCYCIPKIDWNDYTAENEDSTNNVYIIASGVKPTNLCYDADALNYNGTIVVYTDAEGNAYAKSKTYAELQALSGWTQDYNFNYGYPTLNYGYLKRSSYATRDEGTAQGDTGYDAKVITYQYTRLANGIVPSEGDFYMVPNKSVLENMINVEASTGTENTTITKNFAMLYDIDGLTETVNNGYIFKGKFDGRDKTISGLTQSLFMSVQNGEVRNLRLTDTKVETIIEKTENDSTENKTTQVNRGGLLAVTISDSTISNMTLSGVMHIESSLKDTGGSDTMVPKAYLGSLASQATNSSIDTITNLVDIDLSMKEDGNYAYVGGIVGKLDGEDSKILYCSNYGPINIDGAGEGRVIWHSGGIVGEIDSGLIAYSYNATSVTVGYATSSQMSTSKGCFYAGGIAGKVSTGKIQNSYNSGMIKAGNKSNINQYRDGVQYSFGLAYAGGILGYASGSSTEIDNCYNEGAVEALGKNPEFIWLWELNANSQYTGGWTYDGETGFDNSERVELDGTKLALTLRQSSARNVYAYGIGYVEGGTVSNSHVRVATENNDYSDETIYNNGAYAEQYSMLKYWKWSEIVKQLTDYNQSMKATRLDNFNYGVIVAYWVIGRYMRFDFSLHPKPPANTGEVNNIVVTAADELGIPTAFILETELYIYTMLTYRYLATKSSIWTVQDEDRFRTTDGAHAGKEGGSVTITENFSKVYSSAGEDYHALGLGSETEISNVSGGNTINNSENSAIVQGTRSSQLASPNTVNIGGDGYYLADQNNMNSIFNAGIYTYEGEFISDTLQYFSNSSYYSISAKLEGTAIGADILSVTKDGDKTKVNYVISSTSPITGDLSVEVTADYIEEITFNTSELQYVYVDDYSIGITGLTMYADKMHSKYALTTADDTTYDTIFQLSTKQWGKVSNYDEDGNLVSSDNGQPNNRDDSLIYLAYNETDDMYIYIPNATLKSGVSTIEVNTQSNATSDLTEGEGFADNVKKITDYLSGKTFYSRAVSSDSKMETLTASEFAAASGSTTITFDPSKTSDAQTGTLTYGKEVDITAMVKSIISSTTTENEDGSTTTTEYANIYTVLLSDPGAEVIGLLNKTTPYISRNSSGDWGIDATSINLNIDGTTYSFNVRVQNNEAFILESTTDISSDKQDLVINSIKDYFERITYIANDLSDAKTKATITDQFESITINDNGSAETISTSNKENTGSYLSTFKDNTFTINYNVTKTWEGNNDDKISYTQEYDGSLSVSVDKNATSSLTSYTLNGVTIYKGDVDYSASQTYTMSILSGAIKTANDAISYLEVICDDTIINTAVSSSHTGITTSIDTSKDEVKIVAKVYRTYKLDEDDLDEFQLVVQESGANYLLKGQIEWLTPSSESTETYSRDILTSVSQVLKDKDNKDNDKNDVLVTQSVEYIGELSSSDDSGETITLTDASIVNFTTGTDDTILSVVYDGDTTNTANIKSVTVYYKSTGEAYADTSTENTKNYEGASENVYLSNGNYIKLSDLLGMKFKDMQDKIVAIKSGGNTYLAVEPSLTLVDEFEVNSQKYTTSIKRAVYEWNSLSMPTYEKVSKRYSFDSSMWTDDNFTVDYNGGEERQNYVISDNNTIDIILKSGDSYTFKFNYNETANQSVVNLKIEETQTPQSIILTKDISFNNIGAGFEKVDNVNIIGNGHYISYYGASFYRTATGGFIRDVKFLGETYNKSLLVSQGVSSSLYDIELYGSVTNLRYNWIINVSGSTSQSALISYGTGIISNIKTFASVQGGANVTRKERKSNSNDDLEATEHDAYTFKTYESNVTLLDINVSEGSEAINYGLITAQRGEHGMNGTNGTQGSKDGTDGTEGANGNEISAFANKGFTMINYGILHSGNGGNGGAGGSSYHGDDLLINNAGDKTAGVAGKGGTAGESGLISGFVGETQSETQSEAKSIAKGGLAGVDGATARGGFGTIVVTDKIIGHGWLDLSTWLNGSLGQIVLPADKNTPVAWVNSKEGAVIDVRYEENKEKVDKNETSNMDLVKGIFTSATVVEFPNRDVYGNDTSELNKG